MSGIEPTPMRDNGPYKSAEQARAQFDAVAFGLAMANTPHGRRVLARMAVDEVLVATGVQLGDFDDVVLEELAGVLSPEQAQVVAGWVVRAWLSGQNREDDTP